MANGHKLGAMVQDIRYPGVRVGEACGPRTAWQGASAKAQVKPQKINGHKLGTMAQDTRQQCVHDKIIHVFFKWVGGRLPTDPHINPPTLVVSAFQITGKGG